MLDKQLQASRRGGLGRMRGMRGT